MLRCRGSKCRPLASALTHRNDVEYINRNSENTIAQVYGEGKHCNLKRRKEFLG